MLKKISSMKAKKSCRVGDVPANICKIYAAYIAEQNTGVFNCSIKIGQYPTQHPIFFEVQQGFKICSSGMILSDMQENIDLAEYGVKLSTDSAQNWG